MKKIISLISIIVIGIIAIVGLALFVMIMTDSKIVGDDPIDLMIKFTYLVIAITVLAAIFVWVKEMIFHPKKLKQTAISTVIFLAVVAIAKFVLASNKPEHYYPHIDVDGNTSGWVDTGLYTFYILGTIAVLLMFLSPVLSGLGGKNNTVEEFEEEYEDNDEEYEEDEYDEA